MLYSNCYIAFENALAFGLSIKSSKLIYFRERKFLDAGIQDVSTSISIVHDLIEISPDGDESDKHI